MRRRRATISRPSWARSAGFCSDGRRAGVAISIAGVVDPDTGRLKVANIPCLDGRPVAADLSAALGLPVWVFNDADCFALAEARQGAGRGHRNVFGVILGTGRWRRAGDRRADRHRARAAMPGNGGTGRL